MGAAGVGASGTGIGAAVEVGSRAVKLTYCSMPMNPSTKAITSIGGDPKMVTFP